MSDKKIPMRDAFVVIIGFLKDAKDEVEDLKTKVKKLERSNTILKEAYDLLKGDPECTKCGTTEFLCGHNKRD